MREHKKNLKFKGGADPSINPNWCDQHPTQCQDFAGSCQAGGRIDSYRKYKKYKQKYKDLLLFRRDR